MVETGKQANYTLVIRTLPDSIFNEESKNDSLAEPLVALHY